MPRPAPFSRILLSSVALAAPGISRAAITAYSSNFSQTSGANSVTGWVYNGGVGGGVSRSTSALDFTGGDGVAGDGSLALNSGDATGGNETYSFDLTGTMVAGESYTLTGTAFNNGASFSGSYFANLVRISDGATLATSSNLGTNTTNNTTVLPVPFSLNYTALAGDSGSGLRIVFTENWNNASRDGFIDTIALNVAAVPEPSAYGLAGAGALAVVAALRRRKSNKA